MNDYVNTWERPFVRAGGAACGQEPAVRTRKAKGQLEAKSRSSNVSLRRLD